MAHGHHSKGHGKGGMKHFQIKLASEWQDYSCEEERCLIRAYSTGQDTARFSLRGQHYEYDFRRLEQRNADTGKTREIRPPPGMRRPAKAMVPKGRTMVVTLPDRVPMPKAIKVPHPQSTGQMIVVKVPKGARPGKEMLVPIPPVMAEAALVPGGGSYGGGGAAPAAAEPKVSHKDAQRPPEVPKKSGGMGAGKKVAAGVASVAAVGGAVVVGAIVADSVESGAADDVLDDMGDGMADLAEDAGLVDFAEDASEAILDAAEDATEWLAGAGDDAGDFIIDLF